MLLCSQTEHMNFNSTEALLPSAKPVGFLLSSSRQVCSSEDKGLSCQEKTSEIVGATK